MKLKSIMPKLKPTQKSKLSEISKLPKKLNEVQSDTIDTVTFDIPLFIRILEYSREDAKTDMDLHTVAENAIKLSKVKDVLSMNDYESLIK